MLEGVYNNVVNLLGVYYCGNGLENNLVIPRYSLLQWVIPDSKVMKSGIWVIDTLQLLPYCSCAMVTVWSKYPLNQRCITAVDNM